MLSCLSIGEFCFSFGVAPVNTEGIKKLTTLQNSVLRYSRINRDFYSKELAITNETFDKLEVKPL